MEMAITDCAQYANGENIQRYVGGHDIVHEIVHALVTGLIDPCEEENI